jgi:hypothetical protein
MSCMKIINFQGELYDFLMTHVVQFMELCNLLRQVQWNATVGTTSSRNFRQGGDTWRASAYKAQFPGGTLTQINFMVWKIPSPLIFFSLLAIQNRSTIFF